MSKCRVVVLVVALLAAGVSPDHASAAPCWRPPVRGWVSDAFRAPPCPWCAGNRGIEYRTARGAAVRAVAAGTVTYSGVVAGTRYVVVRLGNGWLITYGRLASSGLRRGDVVGRGTVVGRVSTELFFGLRVAGAYRDPAPFLGRLVGRPQLVPTDATSPRRSPPPRLQCGR